MPSSWNVYYVIFLSAVLALTIPAKLTLISHFFFPRKGNKRLRARVLDEVGTKNETLLGRRINARFFLGVNSALILITLVLVIIPCVSQLHDQGNKNALIRALVAIITVAGFSALGLIYSIKKGDLSWLGSFQKAEKGQSQ